MGQPLPTGMTLYPVPLELRQRLGPPPPGYKYVRAASDILLIAIGTSMVVDAIEDLGGL
jgi:Ni/Co efflux regulator RcnB